MAFNLARSWASWLCHSLSQLLEQLGRRLAPELPRKDGEAVLGLKREREESLAPGEVPAPKRQRAGDLLEELVQARERQQQRVAFIQVS